MIDWDESDIGKILVYRGEIKFRGEYEVIAIFGVDSTVPNTVGAASYPISENSKRGFIGLPKNQEKEGREYLEKPGDWFYVGDATEKERGVLEKIAKREKVLLDKNEYNIGTDYPEKLSNAFLEHLLVKCQSK
jgi:hypothetical protein